MVFPMKLKSRFEELDKVLKKYTEVRWDTSSNIIVADEDVWADVLKVSIEMYYFCLLKLTANI